MAASSTWKSEIHKDTYVFRWAITNFTAFVEANGKSEKPLSINSPHFIVNGFAWFFSVCYRLKNELPHLSIFLYPEDYASQTSICRNFKVACKINILGATLESTQEHSFSKTNWNKEVGFGYGWDTVVRISDLRLREDTLNIRCEVDAESETVHGPVLVEMSKTSTALKQYQEDIHGIFETESFPDCEVLTGTKTFHVHKAVLAARSPVFKAMFSTPMLEASESKIVISDFDEAAVKIMLDYIYKGHVGKEMVNDNKLETILQLADKYEVHEFKVSVEAFLQCNITLDNVIRCYRLSLACNSENLRKKCVDFILMKKKEIKQDAKFKDFAKSPEGIDLMLELF